MTPTRPLNRRARRALARGFTLIELLVALVAGLFVAMGAFALAKGATRTFQQETRVANATMSAVFGFRRLVSDLERASYLSTPNIQRDYLLGNAVCLQPNSSMPAGIQELAGVRVEQGGSYATTGTSSPIDGTNGLSPDRITIAGSLVSTEQYAVRAVAPTAIGAPTEVLLNPLSGAVTRTAQGDGTDAPWAGNAQRPGAFMAGRIARIVDTEGFQHFGVISAVKMDGPGMPRVVLQGNPALYIRENGPPSVSNPVCKGIPLGTGSLINMVNRVRYEVRDLRNVAAYADLYAPPKALSNGAALPLPADDANRFELVRSELDVNNQVIAGSEELIAEYAVDLKFGGTVVTQQLVGSQPNPVLAAYDLGDGNIYNYTNVATLSPSALPGPERVRSLRVRFAVRSREADRGTAVPGGLFRYKTASGGYARVRTLQAEVALPNHAGVFW